MINRNLIASCGMNCGICIAHLKKNNSCPGCREITSDCPKTRLSCQIRTCPERNGKYCFECTQFPCDKLERLDKRYRAKYGMSEIENLIFIRDNGINAFMKSERSKWQSAKGTLCVHDKKYYS
ncbi:MAG: DUF3795 domain-containing protein [Bacteroidia bacterium]